MNDNSGAKLEEYKMLREELKHFMDKDTTLFTCLFASVTAVLLFALEWKVPEGCLLAFIVIIPIGSKLAYHQNEMAKISEYMQCFLEKDVGIQWETFLSELSIHPNRPRTAKYTKFSECLMMAVASVSTYMYLVWKEKMWKEQKTMFVLEVFILLFLFVWTVLISRNIYRIKEYKQGYKNVMSSMYL